MRNRSIFIIALIALAPALALAQSSASGSYQFNAQGILGCNQNGAYAKSVGTFTASGVYVPVADAVVELNTGYLVYDECVLRETVDRLRDSAVASLTQNIINAATKGNNGNPQYSTNLPSEMQTKFSNAYAAAVQNGITNNVNAAFQSAVKSAMVQTTYAALNNPTSALSCPYSGNLTALYQGQTTDSALSALGYLALPSCTAIGAYSQANSQATGIAASVVNNALTQLQWGQGVYPRGTTDAYGNIIVSTPSQVLLASLNQAVTSGFRITENANDIGQMTTALFAGLSSQVLSGSGLAGLTQSSSGQSSYLQQAVTAANAGVTQSIATAASSVLGSAIQTEQDYLQDANSIATILSSAITTLRGSEAACWNTIISNVCQSGTLQYASNGTATCTEIPTSGSETTVTTTTSTIHNSNSQTTTKTVASVTLTISTSTYGFAQQIINANIAATASTTLQQISVATQNIQTLNQIQQSVQNSSSQSAQNQAIDEVDTLTANGQLQTPTDLSSIQQEQTTIQQTISNLQTTIQSTWTTNTPDNPPDANSGWCNPSAYPIWEQLWSK